MRNFSIKSNIFLLLALSIVGLMIPAFIVLKSQMLDDKKEKTKNLVESAYSVLVYYKKTVNDGKMNEDDAKKAALSVIKSLRYNQKEYFWINDSTLPYPKMVMHATNPKLDGKTLDDKKYNCATGMQNGDYADMESTGGDKNLFQAFVEVCKKSGSGYVTYLWPKPKEGGGLTDERFPKLSYVKEFKEWGFVIGSGIYVDDLDDDFMGTVVKNLVYIIPVLIVLILLSWGIIGAVSVSISSVVLPIQSLADSMQKGEGDLRVKIPEFSKNELNAVVAAVNVLLESFRSNLSYAKQNISENVSVSTHLAEASADIGKRVEEDVKTIDTIFEEAKNAIKGIEAGVEKGEIGKQNVKAANDILLSSKSELAKMVGSVRESVAVESEFASRLQSLSEEAERVKGVLSVIGDIADQTNLLALNAAIEAARAGEHGRGFAVVADEVRKLAERTQKSLTETNVTINTIVQSINDAADQMGKNAQSIMGLENSSMMIEEEIQKSVAVMGKTADIISEIASLSVHNADKVGDITAKLSKINDAAHINARSVEEIAASIEHLNSMSEALGQKLKRFET